MIIFSSTPKSISFYIIKEFLFTILGTTDRVVSDQDEKLSRTLKHFKEYIHNKFNRYAFGFFFCELLNLFLAFIGFWITHRFLNDEFLTYGFDVYRQANDIRSL